MDKLTDLIPRKVDLMIKDNIVMIDVRREEEFKTTGIIKNAHKLTFFDNFGNYNLEEWMNNFEKLVISKEQVFILICAHANRTRTIGDFLIENGYKNCAHLYGGMAQWIDEGRETIFE